jgi:hypothetical protein
MDAKTHNSIVNFIWNIADDCVKIGESTQEINIRKKELDDAAIPFPLGIFAATFKYNMTEKLIHKVTDMTASDIQIKKNRKFFNIMPIKAYGFLKLGDKQYNSEKSANIGKRLNKRLIVIH